MAREPRLATLDSIPGDLVLKSGKPLPTLFSVTTNGTIVRKSTTSNKWMYTTKGQVPKEIYEKLQQACQEAGNCKEEKFKKRGVEKPVRAKTADKTIVRAKKTDHALSKIKPIDGIPPVAFAAVTSEGTKIPGQYSLSTDGDLIVKSQNKPWRIAKNVPVKIVTYLRLAAENRQRYGKKSVQLSAAEKTTNISADNEKIIPLFGLRSMRTNHVNSEGIITRVRYSLSTDGDLIVNRALIKGTWRITKNMPEEIERYLRRGVAKLFLKPMIEPIPGTYTDKKGDQLEVYYSKSEDDKYIRKVIDPSTTEGKWIKTGRGKVPVDIKRALSPPQKKQLTDPHDHRGKPTKLSMTLYMKHRLDSAPAAENYRVKSAAPQRRKIPKNIYMAQTAGTNGTQRRVIDKARQKLRIKEKAELHLDKVDMDTLLEHHQTQISCGQETTKFPTMAIFGSNMPSHYNIYFYKGTSPLFRVTVSRNAKKDEYTATTTGTADNIKSWWPRYNQKDMYDLIETTCLQYDIILFTFPATSFNVPAKRILLENFGKKTWQSNVVPLDTGRMVYKQIHKWLRAHHSKDWEPFILLFSHGSDSRTSKISLTLKDASANKMALTVLNSQAEVTFNTMVPKGNNRIAEKLMDVLMAKNNPKCLRIKTNGANFESLKLDTAYIANVLEEVTDEQKEVADKKGSPWDNSAATDDGWDWETSEQAWERQEKYKRRQGEEREKSEQKDKREAWGKARAEGKTEREASEQAQEAARAQDFKDLGVTGRVLKTSQEATDLSLSKKTEVPKNATKITGPFEVANKSRRSNIHAVLRNNKYSFDIYFHNRNSLHDFVASVELRPDGSYVTKMKNALGPFDWGVKTPKTQEELQTLIKNTAINFKEVLMVWPLYQILILTFEKSLQTDWKFLTLFPNRRAYAEEAIERWLSKDVIRTSSEGSFILRVLETDNKLSSITITKSQEGFNTNWKTYGGDRIKAKFDTLIEVVEGLATQVHQQRGIACSYEGLYFYKMEQYNKIANNILARDSKIQEPT